MASEINYLQESFLFGHLSINLKQLISFFWIPKGLSSKLNTSWIYQSFWSLKQREKVNDWNEMLIL